MMILELCTSDSHMSSSNLRDSFCHRALEHNPLPLYWSNAIRVINYFKKRETIVENIDLTA